jgi:hypothetical protein
MRVIIAGSRDLDIDTLTVATTVLLSGWKITEVVCGGARGPDTAGELWGIRMGLTIHYFLPQWKEYGKSAGFIRNQQMADYSDALIAFWDGHSRGTAHMINAMRELGKPVYIEIATPHTSAAHETVSASRAD